MVENIGEIRCSECGWVIGYSDLVLNEVLCRSCWRREKLLLPELQELESLSGEDFAEPLDNEEEV